MRTNLLIEEYTTENPTGHPEHLWPVFKDGHGLMAWYRSECSKLEYGMNYREAVIALRNYCRQNKSVVMTEDCWSKFLSCKAKNGEPLWHFTSFTPATTPWYSRSNDILLANLLEGAFFPPPKPQQPGRPRFSSRYDRPWIHGPATALAAAVKWLLSKPDVVTEVGPKWSLLLAAVTSWAGEAAPYLKRLGSDFEKASSGLIIKCTHHILAPELRLTFLKQMIPSLSQSASNHGFLFQVYTDYSLWTEGDWFPRNVEDAKSFMHVAKAPGLNWSDNNTNYAWKKRQHEYRRLLNKLPAYAVTVLLEDALLHPSKKDSLPIWPELSRLPLERREALLRNHCGDVGILWTLCPDFFVDEGDDDHLQATVHILNSLLPEHSDIWSTGSTLGLNLSDMFFYLDNSCAGHDLVEIALPENIRF